MDTSHICSVCGASVAPAWITRHYSRTGHSYTPAASAYDRAVAYARAEGARAGRNAAEWYVQDTIGGRVTRGEADTARRILAGIADGDPAVLDTFPRADLSGQWADTLTGPQLVEDAIAASHGTRHAPRGGAESDTPWFTDICDAYDAAFSEAVEDAIASAARAILS